MRSIPILIVGFLAASFATKAFPDAVPLHAVAFCKDVKVDVHRTDGHSRVFIGVCNLAQTPREIKFPGSYLKPRSKRYQRLALGYQEYAREGTVKLEAGDVWKGWVTCCCMDKGLSSPDINTAYDVSLIPAPRRVRLIMEDWAEKPWLSQSEVNGRVWRVRSAPPRPRYNFRGARVLAWEGRILVLLKSGTLLRNTREGGSEVLGEGVFAVGTGFGRTFARFGEERIREYVEATGKWVDRGLLKKAEHFIVRPRQVLAVKGCALHRLDGTGRWRVLKSGITGATASPDPYAGTVVLLTPPSHGRTVECTAGRERDWYVLNGTAFQSAAVTESVVYGMDGSAVYRISPKGRTRVIARSGDLLAHRKGIYLVQRGWKICEYRDGDRGWRTHEIPGDVVSYSVDPVTGILYALKTDGKVMALREQEVWSEAGILA